MVCGHRNIAIQSRFGYKGAYFPTYATIQDDSWKRLAYKAVSLTLTGTSSRHSHLKEDPYKIEIMHILRIQIPGIQQFVTRVTCRVDLSGGSCCQDTSRVKWLPVNDVIKGTQPEDGWGPELKLFTRRVTSQAQGLNFTEIGINEACKFITDQQLR